MLQEAGRGEKDFCTRHRGFLRVYVCAFENAATKNSFGHIHRFHSTIDLVPVYVLHEGRFAQKAFGGAKRQPTPRRPYSKRLSPASRARLI